MISKIPCECDERAWSVRGEQSCSSPGPPSLRRYGMPRHVRKSCELSDMTGLKSFVAASPDMLPLGGEDPLYKRISRLRRRTLMGLAR